MAKYNNSELVPLNGYSPDIMPNKVILYNRYHPSEMINDTNKITLDLLYKGEIVDSLDGERKIYFTSQDGAMDGGKYSAITFYSAIFVADEEYWGMVNIRIDCGYINTDGGKISMYLNMSTGSNVEFKIINTIDSDFTSHDLDSAVATAHAVMKGSSNINYKYKSIDGNKAVSIMDNNWPVYSNRLSDLLVKNLPGPDNLNVNSFSLGNKSRNRTNNIVKYLSKSEELISASSISDIYFYHNNYILEDGKLKSTGGNYYVDVDASISLIPELGGNALIAKSDKILSIEDNKNFGSKNIIQIFGSAYLISSGDIYIGDRKIDGLNFVLDFDQNSKPKFMFVSVGYNAFIDINTGCLYEIKQDRSSGYQVYKTEDVLIKNSTRIRNKNIFIGLDEYTNETIYFLGYYSSEYYIGVSNNGNSMEIIKIILK